MYTIQYNLGSALFTTLKELYVHVLMEDNSNYIQFTLVAWARFTTVVGVACFGGQDTVPINKGARLWLLRK